ncbi:hypothetical protein E6O75_ATG08054 [Venturia nashicola]|uniref:Uncharacterized protein n=1 Tax=Venturia nashicola TaxID=86259 RepID=A0A4Z1NNM9_9PEZI|nr:hypothetical protein E6O75_ATG08054 [Venturia nashicola]
MAHIPPATKDEFSYSIDSFFVEASGHNHRRATESELEAIFHPKKSAETPKDPVGHWYEAQLRHYGLAPSKNKAVAKTRLLDAVNAGNLAVPRDIKAVETQLAKEWAKRHREARAAIKKAESGASKETTATKEAKATSKKRKADIINDPVAQSATKKISKAGSRKEKVTPIKTSKSPTTAAAKNATIDKSVTSAKSIAITPKTARNTASQPPSTKSIAKTVSLHHTPPTTERSTEKKPRTKQTARRGGATLSGRGKPQTARRGGLLAGASRHLHSFKVEDEGHGVKNEATDSDAEEMDYQYANDSNPPSPAFGSLGLLNGTYEITCDDLRDWSMYDDAEFTLIMALQGTEIWMSYDFGMFSGIMHLFRRPFEASDARLEFTWRGVENSEGVITYDGRGGWIQFLGNGEIEGMIPCYGEARFRGTRISGNATRSERSAVSMGQEWDGYSESEYERERVGRWR